MGSQWELAAISAAVLEDRGSNRGEVDSNWYRGAGSWDPGGLVSNKKCATWCGLPSHRHNLRWTVISRTTKVASNPRCLHSVAIYRATSLLRRQIRVGGGKKSALELVRKATSD